MLRSYVSRENKNSHWAKKKINKLLQLFTNRPLQKRERTGKEYGCFPFA